MMKPSEALQLHREAILKVVAQNHAMNPRIFGSTLLGMDTDQSDLDLLVDPTSETTLLDIARIQCHLEDLLCVPVDVLTPKAIPERFRADVLKRASRI